MSLSKRLQLVTVMAMLVLALIALFRLFTAPRIPVPSFDPNTIPMESQELEQWVVSLRTAGYNVDVKVNKHAWERHSTEATDAIRCLTNNGTAVVLSEKNSRNLHLICTDPTTQESWVVVIERIRRYADSLQNATSRMITGFKLTNVTVEQYVAWETNVKAIVVNLRFFPGELFFVP